MVSGSFSIFSLALPSEALATLSTTPGSPRCSLRSDVEARAASALRNHPGAQKRRTQQTKFLLLEQMDQPLRLGRRPMMRAGSLLTISTGLKPKESRVERDLRVRGRSQSKALRPLLRRLCRKIILEGSWHRLSLYYYLSG